MLSACGNQGAKTDQNEQKNADATGKQSQNQDKKQDQTKTMDSNQKEDKADGESKAVSTDVKQISLKAEQAQKTSPAW